MATNIGKDGAVYSGSNAVAEIRDWSLETTSEVADDIGAATKGFATAMAIAL